MLHRLTQVSLPAVHHNVIISGAGRHVVVQMAGSIAKCIGGVEAIVWLQVTAVVSKGPQRWQH